MEKECELNFASDQHIPLGRIYYNENNYKDCARLLVPFMDAWAFSSRNTGLWKLVLECCKEEEFVSEWKTIVGDLHSHFEMICDFLYEKIEVTNDLSTVLDNIVFILSGES